MTATIQAQKEKDAALAANASLLNLNAKIREYEHWAVVAKRRRRLSIASYALGPALFLVLYALIWLPGFDRRTLIAVGIPGFIIAIAFCISAYQLSRNPGGGPKEVKSEAKHREGKASLRRRSEGEIELQIAKKRDARKLQVADGTFDQKTRRLIYKDEAYNEIERLRGDSKRYRHVNNILQGVLIIGSISATAASGVSSSGGPVRWVVLGVTLAVGISSGFMGYYKYKERSFYLQQTADAIEHEWEAFEVGVGRYKYCKTEEIALKEFVEEVHRLKSEQRKRQQNLEQPPETRNTGEL
ncbi:DUF4231 domain-containing protein [Amycolatopsis umgeniensis]|uniref:DUF4231 domain-containing protein n=1 Tax=Amycolatopsis umgeniensis TaxID=336628 RepID=A0A841AZQ9_9PSEU|nr:DUF4231 domain-containing protein [Amycolatopsis umgeniensis]MBB5851754.1 hypothetical protein [Amycolatopsis umgeniensis]